METFLFTPRKSRTDFHRIEMQLSAEDKAKIFRGRWSAEITDINTGKKYKVAGAACNIPHCMCDAVIIKEL